MALGIVQNVCKNSLYLYAEGKSFDQDCSYAELLAELTTELELALEDSKEGTATDFGEETDSPSEEGKADSYSTRKKEWEEQLEKAMVVEAMLRQALENGLGQQKEEQPTPQKQEEEEADNDFSLEGVPMMVEGKSKSSPEASEDAGNSKFLQTTSGHGEEYFSPSNGGRKVLVKPQLRMICLTCEIECDRKKLQRRIFSEPLEKPSVFLAEGGAPAKK